MQVSHMVEGAQTLVPSSAAFLRPLDWEWSSWDTNKHQYGMFFPLHHSVGPKLFFEGQKERREREFSHLLVYFFIACSSLGWAILKSEAQSEFPMWMAGTLVLQHSLLISRVCISGKLDLGAEPGLESRHSDTGCRWPK